MQETTRHSSILASALDEDEKLFIGHRRSTNIRALRYGTLLGPPAIAAFTPIIWWTVTEDFWLLFRFQVFCFLIAIGLALFAKYYPALVRKHVDALIFSLFVPVGWFSAALALFHDGYESPYCMTLLITVTGVGFFTLWPLGTASLFNGIVYTSFLLPLLLGFYEINDWRVFTIYNLIIVITVVIFLVYRRQQYALERRAFIGNLQLERARAGLEQANEKLRQLDRAKSDFFANVSHELRTPLTLSLGPIEALASEEQRETKREQLQMVQRNQLRLLKLINDLLDFAKLEAGRAELAISRVNVQEHLKLLLSTVEQAAQLRDVQLKLEFPEEPVHLYIDRDKFEKVVMNLLSNAFKFTDPHGAITISLRIHEDEALISVADTGIGIPNDKLATIFERFSQVDASTTRKYSGTGIGLALVKEYSELHGGRVEVESEPGKGSTFTLHFKLGREHLNQALIEEVEIDDERPLNVSLLTADITADKEEASDRISIESIAQLVKSSPPEQELSSDVQSNLAEIESRMMKDVKVLVVDDTPDMRKYMAGLLRPHYQVFNASNGQEAFEMAKVIVPDLIVSDVMMPNMSGDELCKRIREEPGRLSRTAVMLVTARTDPKGKLEGLETGADDYLYKPFVPAELLLRARNLIRQRRQDRALMFAHQQLGEKQRLLDEDLEMARDFQLALLSAAASSMPELKLATVYKPALAVGGDFYDVSPLESNLLRVFMADATDHGVQAAFRTMMIKAEYDRLKTTVDSPAALLTQLNRLMLERYPNDKNAYLGSNVTFAAVCADVHMHNGGMQITLAGGGHEQPRRVAQGKIDELFVAGLTIGRLKGISYGEKRFELHKGERLYLYSDGLVEQPNARGEMFSGDKLDHALKAAQSQGDVQRAAAQVVGEWEQFRGDVPPQDDVTLIALEV